MFQDPSTRYRNITLLLGSMLTTMGGLLIAPSVAGMGAHFSHIPNVKFLASLAVTLPSLMVAIISFSMGALVDRYGRRPILLISALICGLIGSAGYFLNSLMIILATRLCLGFGIAGLMTSITTIAGDVFSGEELKRFLGLQSMAMSMGGIIFVGIGGALADISWRMPFGMYSVSLLLLIGFIFFVPETRKFIDVDKKTPVDAPTEGANTTKPIFPLATLFFAFALVSSFFYMSPVLMAQVFETLDLNAVKVGLALALLSLSTALMGTQFHSVANKFSTVSTLIWIFVCLTLGYFIIGSAHSFVVIVMGLVITGLGLGIYIPLTYACGMAVVENKHLGLAIGTITSANFFGQFLAPIAGNLLQSVSLQGAFVNVARIACGVLMCLVFCKIYEAIKK